MIISTRPYDNPFTFTINTTLTGTTPSNQFTLSVDSTRNDYDYEVDWGDGIRERYNNNTIKIHTYISPGIYKITVRGKFPNPAYNNTNDVKKIISIDSWGKLGLGYDRFSNAFNGASNCTSIPSIGDNFWNCAVLNASFSFMSSLVKAPVLNIRNATNISDLFRACNLINRDATGLVTLSNGILLGTNTFFTIELEYNYSIIICGRFFNILEVLNDTTAIIDDRTTVISVPATFKLAGISKLNTSNVTSVGAILQGNPNLVEVPKFDFSKATSMSYSFAACTSLLSIPHFDTSKVTELNFRSTGGSAPFNGCFNNSGIRNVSCSGTVTLNAGVLTGSGTNFISELKLDHDVIINNQWFEVIAINSATEALVNDINTIITTPSFFQVAGFPKLNLNSLIKACGAWFACTFLQKFPPIDMPSALDLGNAWQDCTSLTSFPLIDVSNTTILSSTWFGCTGLTSFPLLDVGSCTNFFQAWRSCSSLTSFPLLDTSNGLDFSFAWWSCTGLTSFPLLDTSKGTNFNGTWVSCTRLTSFPLLNTGNGTNFNSTWQNCGGLTSFPLLDTSKGINFDKAWQNCSGLTSFPLLTTSSATNFTNTWDGCIRLISFPLINSANVTLFTSAWRGCTALTSFPLLSTWNGIDFQNTWMNCSALTIFPLVDTSKGTNFFQAWLGCTGLTSFPALNVSNATNLSRAWLGCTRLTSFPLLTTTNCTNFERSWQNCSSLTSFPIIDTSNATRIDWAWNGCTGLTSFPALNLTKAQNLSRAWGSCTFTSFPLITVRDATTFASSWRECRSLTTFPPNVFDGWTGTPLPDCFLDTWLANNSLTATSVENILVSINVSGRIAPATGKEITIVYNAATGVITSTTNTAITSLKTKGWIIKINGVVQ